MAGHQSWVTHATDDTEALKAIALARSLQHVVSRRPSTVFVGHLVSDEIQELLEFEFNRCIRISKGTQENRFGPLDFPSVAKIQAWRLTKFSKIVFLDPNCLVLKNCDELFRNNDLLGYGTECGEKEINVFVCNPSEKIWSGLVSNVKEFGGVESLEKICEIKEYPENVKAKYLNTLNFHKQSDFAWNGEGVSILHFPHGHPLDILLETTNGHPDMPLDGTLQRELFDFCVEHLPIQEMVKMNHILLPNLQAKLEKLLSLPQPKIRELEELKDSIAIVGIGMRLPSCNTLEEFWDLLANGGDAIVPVPSQRWTKDRCWDSGVDHSKIQAGFLKCPVDEIDAKFFGLSHAELTMMDPQQRLTLQVLWEALEHGGINPTKLKETKTSVFGGWWRHDYKEMLQESNLIAESDFFRYYMGNSLGTLTGRVSHVLDITGPSISTESGCSTSIVAVDMACKSLLNEDSDLALAFGVNLFLHPFSLKTLNSVIAEDGHCKTFDKDADGFGRAEGCVALILKRFPDALRDGDVIQGLIRGSAVVQEGPSRSMGTPTKGCEALAMKLALENAGVKPQDVKFVETHGTGTPVGDPLEVAAICEAYSSNRKDDLVIGSVKTNIGHTESCSGISGIIKTILSLQKEIIPPHRNFQELNPDINLEAIPATIPLKRLDWKRSREKARIAGVSSFGITGTDAHVIIQETPEEEILQSTFRKRMTLRNSPIHFMKLGAKAPEAFPELASNLKKFLHHSHTPIEDVCYTGNVGRGDFPFRSFLIGRDKESFLEQLQKGKDKLAISQVPNEVPKLGFLFTGQGSQFHGMGKQLYETYPIFKLHFDSCSSFLEKNYSITIKEAIWGKDEDKLSRTMYSQTSIFVLEFALLKLWESWGVKPDFVLGHSLGEFAAAVGAGILSPIQALTLVAERTRLIDNLPTGKMIAIKKSKPEMEEFLKIASTNSSFWLDFAAFNSPEQTVFAGTAENVEAFADICRNNGAKCHILQATHAFHSRMMDPMLEEYRKVCEKMEYNKPNCPFISGMEGKIVTDVNPDYWVRHTREPVRFSEASKALLESEARTFLEVGPQPVLSALLMYNSDSVVSTTAEPIQCLPSLRKNEEDLATLLTTIGNLYVKGCDIEWESFHAFSSGRKVSSLPFYPFQNKAHWFDMDTGRRGRIIHPLLGIRNPNPSEMKLFQNDLDVQNSPFLKDHVIGNTIIYPGAGFLEMCLVAGHAALQCLESDYNHPQAPISLEDFLIEAPLALAENERTHLQTMVQQEDNGDVRITIYSKLTLDKETSKWIRHASASFSPYAIQFEGEEELKTESLSSILSRCTEAIECNETYDKFENFGLKFGPAFRTLTKAWKGEEECCFQLESKETMGPFITHPVIIDAMFQALTLSSSSKEVLQVPLSVNKFIWLDGQRSLEEVSSFFIHCHRQGDESQAVLYNAADGRRLAVMIGALLVETTAATILSSIEAQRTSLPSMYEEVWREDGGTWWKRISTASFAELPNALPKELYNSISAALNDQEQAALVHYDLINKLCLQYFLKSLQDLNYKQSIGDVFTLQEVCGALKIPQTLKLYIRYWLLEMCEDGLLKLEDISDLRNPVFKAKRPFPDDVVGYGEQLADVLGKLEEISYNPSEVRALTSVGENLTSILTGEKSGLSILFPESEDSSTTHDSPAKLIYFESELNKGIRISSIPTIEKVLEECFLRCGNEKPILRVLEIGAGTGSCTEFFVSVIKQADDTSTFEYTFTDVSPAFFPYGDKAFQGSKIKHHCKTLNIEVDPSTQGFVPNSYDLVIASFVIHATQNLREALSNIQSLLRPRGLFFLSEFSKPFRATNMIFGIVEGFWRFNDFDLRPLNCELQMEKWEQLLKETQFRNVMPLSVYYNHCCILWAEADPDKVNVVAKIEDCNREKWLLFSEEGSLIGQETETRLKQLGKDVKIILPGEQFRRHGETFDIRRGEQQDFEKLFYTLEEDGKFDVSGIIYLWGHNKETTTNYETICKPFLSLCKTLMKMEKVKVFVFTQGAVSTGGLGESMLSPFPSLLWGMARSLQNENANISCRCVDLDPTSSLSDSIEDAFSELFLQEFECSVTYRKRQRLLCRFSSLKLPNNSLPFPKSEYFQLLLPPTNAIRDLKFVGMDKTGLELAETEILVKVKAYALNFRDVFVVLKPTLEFEKFNAIGLDFAGEVVEVGAAVTKYVVGDSVMGINTDENKALPSHLKMEEGLVMHVPQGMTHAEAATLPAVSATAFLCLKDVAKIRKGENVLIHTGSGGVGLIAIQIAKVTGCNIITTAGSPRKRAYLRNLGIQHVFNSRSTEFEEDIRAALGGNEVDVVLNSLTGPGFKEASLSLCKPGARFVEMSKLNVWTEEEVREKRPDVFYKIVDLTKLGTDEAKRFMSLVQEHLSTGLVKPISNVRFDASDVRDALCYLEKARHIGKVVCMMPSLDKSCREMKGREWRTEMLNPFSTYLITGGMGGIGFEVAKWMASSGARNIILVGRRPPTEKVMKEIEKLSTSFPEVKVIFKECDVGNFQTCKRLIDWISSKESLLPPLRGIMHAAGVISDASYENQDWGKYEETFHPKVQGAWNLHNLTLSHPLEHFVLFSSGTALFGTMGQSNHCAANVFLDSLAHYRNSIGLPSSTINWGQWGQVGVAAHLEITGLKPISPLQGISALQKIMKRPERIQTAVIEANFNIFRKVFVIMKSYFRDFKEGKSEKDEPLNINGEEFWKEYDACEGQEERVAAIKKLLKIIVRKVLKMGEEEDLDENAQLQDLGMDSLMSLELKNSLQSLIGNRAQISLHSVKDCTTISTLGARVEELLEGNEGAIDVPTREEFMELVRSDAILEEDIKPENAESVCRKPSGLKTVLITGVTGNLGPYMLREISNLSQIQNIYCLVRTTSKKETANERLQAILKEKGLFNEIILEKVECFSGNLIDEKLGLDSETYNKLCSEVDSVIHLGVKSSWQDIYRKTKKLSGTSGRSVNVFGTKNIIKFACKGKTKHIYYGSSTLAATTLDDHGRLTETWPQLEDFDNLPNDAYAVSKFVCELLLKQAVERGVPCKVFRFPGIAGDSALPGGGISPLNNQILLRVMSFMSLKTIPAYRLPLILVPVNLCASISTEIFFSDDVSLISEVYNISNPFVSDEQDFKIVAEELGHPLDLVEPETFEEKVRTAPNSELLIFVKKGIENVEFKERLQNKLPKTLIHWMKGDKVFDSRKLESYFGDKYFQIFEPSITIFKRDLVYCKNSGVFKKFGLE